MGLVEILNASRMNINDLDLSVVRPGNIHDPMDTRGRIAERLAEKRLQNCPGLTFHEDLPMRVNGYELKRRDSGIVVVEHGRTKLEYDFVVHYEGRTYLVQVVALKLNGIEAELPRDIAVGKVLFGDDVRLLLFMPRYSNKVADADRIETTHPQVAVVDSGYKNKQLARAVSRFYSERRMGVPVPKGD